jgi:copper chaperone CopZ
MNAHENCHVDLLDKPMHSDMLPDAMAAYLAVWGMGCPNCAKRVHNGLLRLDGVLQVDVLQEQSIAVVTYDPQKVSADDLLQAVADSGQDSRHNYSAGVMTVMSAAEALVK